MQLISWNVNGVRAALKSGHFESMVESAEPDILCLQETKARPDQVVLDCLAGYHALWNCAEKAGYSGTAIFSKTEPLSSQLGIGSSEHDKEGRVITAEFRDFFLVNVYTPNSQRELARLDYRQQWNSAFLAHVQRLEATKPVIFCGDLNVAHTEIDLANPKSNRKNAGFSDEERADFSKILDAGYVDSFRTFTPDPGHYSWWTYRNNARERNIGWRLDYWIVSQALISKVKGSEIRADVLGSDHCPVSLTLKRGIR
ncbi:MAG: exodeoxyribonuclease-3 [Verrucomicrobiales bacterium]|jgi:exodeoxyribonuclease-3